MSALEEIEKSIVGTWVLTKNENLDGYLKEIGVNFVLRKLANAASSTMTISVDQTTQKVRIVTKGPKDSDHEFSLDTEVESNDPQDNLMRATVTWEEGKLVTDSKPAPGSKAKATKVIRSIEDGNLVMAIVTWQDGKLITEAKPTEGSNGKATRVERQVVGEELVMV
ncbi:hypothetical protein FSP39_000421 [Pinctada imbricata]|uniref:Lipocalin/cytosolic fatty-acid binding domain-containing protein n=1 Tax=Pinctada imbricata TaxID=66713 RepID=A0AA88XDZ0_PINIB|nr:hypothetical protein FSP39_000421 [Pinctada imbricata]